MGMCKPSGGITKQVGKIGELDPQSDPNTRTDLYNEDDALLQQRWYGPDGFALWDRDWNHGGKSHTFPHDHPWDWLKKEPRQKLVNQINKDYC